MSHLTEPAVPHNSTAALPPVQDHGIRFDVSQCPAAPDTSAAVLAAPTVCHSHHLPSSLEAGDGSLPLMAPDASLVPQPQGNGKVHSLQGAIDNDLRLEEALSPSSVLKGDPSVPQNSAAALPSSADQALRFDSSEGPAAPNNSTQGMGLPEPIDFESRAMPSEHPACYETEQATGDQDHPRVEQTLSQTRAAALQRKLYNVIAAPHDASVGELFLELGHSASPGSNAYGQKTTVDAHNRLNGGEALLTTTVGEGGTSVVRWGSVMELLKETDKARFAERFSADATLSMQDFSQWLEDATVVG